MLLILAAYICMAGMEQVVDFFKSSLWSLNERARASYQQPNKLTGIHDKCISLFKSLHFSSDFHLTKSCTQSLEVAIAGLPVPRGSEIIIPSFAFVSCANAIHNYGHQCVFVDCDPKTMNISPEAIEAALTPQTKAVMTINYGGVSCDYDAIKAICKEHQLFLIEDNAHGFLAKSGNTFLGNFGDVATISFDHMKNISCEEGGGISINNPELSSYYRTALEFGTNRADFFEGIVDFYEWKSSGSNCFLAESLASILYEQMQQAPEIIRQLRESWHFYYDLLKPLSEEGFISLAELPEAAQTNGHIFWLKAKDREKRDHLLHFLKARSIFAAVHYMPLHQSAFGKKVGVFRGADQFSTAGSYSLLRLPQHHFLEQEQIFRVVASIYEFYNRPFSI